MRLVPVLLLSLGVSGCHVLTGFEDLSLREDPEHAWSESFGDELLDVIDDATLSPTRLRVAGQFEGMLALGESSLEAAVPARFLAQFDRQGEHDWSLMLDPNVTHHGLVEDTTRLVISHDEPVSVAGLQLPASGETAFEVIDVNEDGVGAELVFAGTATQLTAARVTQVPDELAILVFGGTYEGTLAIGDACEVTSSDQNIAVGLIVERECTWLTSFGDGQNQWVDAVAADGAGNIVVAGRFQGEIDFGNDKLVTLGGTDYFLAKLDDEGNALWSRRFGDLDRDQRPIALAVRPSGTITVAGYFSGTVDFGTGEESASLGHDIFVAKMDPSGNTVWTRHFNVRNDEVADPDPELGEQVLTSLSLEVDRAGNTVLAGHFRASVDFGGTVRATDGDLDLFLAKLDVDGGLKWSGSFGDSTDQCAYTDCVTALAIDSSDKIILGGGFTGSMNLGGDDLESAGEADAFLATFER